MDMIPTPRDFLEYLADLKLSDEFVDRIHYLMSQNTEGRLTVREHQELTWMVKLNQQLSIAKARAMLLLGRRPNINSK